MDGKKVIIVGHGCSGIGRSVREAIALSKLKNSGFEVVEYKPEKEELKELSEQLNSIIEREKVIQSEPYTIEILSGCETPFIPNQKIRSKYKRNLKYR